MKISARIHNSNQHNNLQVETDNQIKELVIPSKSVGKGSSVNGGELLFAALATCACNDIYREAAKNQLLIESVEVFVEGEFGKEGEPGSNITYTIKVDAPQLTQEQIVQLIMKVDSVAEIHNTIRRGTEVHLKLIS